MKIHFKDIRPLILKQSEDDVDVNTSIRLSFARLYNALGLNAPQIIAFESPYQLQKAINLAKGQRGSLTLKHESFASLNLFLADYPKALIDLNQRLWDYVGNQIARPLFLAYGSEEKASQQYQLLNPAFQEIEAAIEEENNRQLKRDHLQAARVAHHPHWRDHQWLSVYRDHWDKVNGARDLANILGSGLMHAYCFENLVLWCPKPNRVEGEDDRLHHENGPALMWNNHYRLYYWQGIPVPAKLIEAPELISRQDLEEHKDPAIRNCFLEKLGWKKLSELYHLQVIDIDKDNQNNQQMLFRCRTIDFASGEQCQFARVHSPTTQRNYFVKVPPQLNNVWDAVGWVLSQYEKS